MTAPIRVLVVDDAVIVRRLVAMALAKDTGIEVVGSASDGDIAIAQLEKLAVDVVVLDIDMPTMNGLAALREIRKRWPALPVVVFTGMAEPGPAELEALTLGASDVVQKLPHEGNMLNAMEWVTTRLVPRLRAVVSEWRTRSPAPPAARVLANTVAVSAVRPARRTRPNVLLIGTSTGGPDALERLLCGLPADFPLPILIVQHMPVGFTRLLAERISVRTPFPAAEAAPGDVVEPGRIRIAPGDYHMTVHKAGATCALQTNREAPENSCRPAVDVLFRSAVRVYGAGVLGVVLTGMGYDGLKGSEGIVAAGGQVLVQDEASSVVWGMPGAVARAGLASGILPLDALAEAVLQRTRSGLLLAAQS
jgi:two-component system chemotaxis response regulator CheB